MNFLIIGNGFDIAHELPTSYNDFLDMCKLVRKFLFGKLGDKVSVERRYKRGKISEEEMTKVEIFAKSMGALLSYNFQNNVSKNFWIKYFSNKRNKKKVGEKWVDFEEEIRNVLIRVRQAEENDTNDEIIKLDADIKECIYDKKIIVYSDLYNYLFEEHKKLVLAIDIYMGYYISSIDIAKKTFFNSNSFNYVLSFNYTNTFRRLYDLNTEVCFIHGCAREIWD